MQILPFQLISHIFISNICAMKKTAQQKGAR